MYRDSTGLRFSPSDLCVYLESEFASFLDRWYLEQRSEKLEPEVRSAPKGKGICTGHACVPDGPDEEADLYKRRGTQHEAAYLASLKDAGHDVIEIVRSSDALERTLAAIQSGAKYIYQAQIEVPPFGGFADFLARCDGTSRLGEFHYEVLDTKLGRSAKPSYVVQLMAYTQMLERIQGILGKRFGVVLGDGNHEFFATNRFRYYFARLQQSFLNFHSTFDPKALPHPGGDRFHGRWSQFAKRILAESDHLRCVANITAGQIEKLERNGIGTMRQLAESKRTAVPGLSDPIFRRLRQQAALQIHSRGQERPSYELQQPDPELPRRGLALLPPPSDGDVFFDIEGFPLVQGGLEYLFGAVTIDDGKPQFHDWWAHDARQERRSFEAFVDFVVDRRQRFPDMHIYHYAAYETSALRRLMGQYATREQEVDDLLRQEVFVDLYTVVRQGLVVGTPSYSLKEIERLFQPPRRGEVKTAGGSIVAYQQWLDSGDPPDWPKSQRLQEIRDYNLIDCESLWKLADWLRDIQRTSGRNYVPHAAAQTADEEQKSPPEKSASVLLAEKLRAEAEAGQIPEENQALQTLLAGLLEFHWREAKPVFWRMFDRHEMTHEQLCEDLDCLGDLKRTRKAPRPVKRSKCFEYAFDPNQDTKLHAGSQCFFSHDLSRSYTIETLDADRGRVEIKLGPSVPDPPDRLSLIPDEHVSADVIAKAVYRFVDAWSKGEILSRAVDDLLQRQRPRIRGFQEGNLVDEADDLVPQVVDLVGRMDQTVLCIQGPPGTGKTFTAASAIVALLVQGKRVGVTANSHKAILNVMEAVAQQSTKNGFTPRLVKVGGAPEEGLIVEGIAEYVEGGAGIHEALGTGPLLLGATAWSFSREDLQGKFDYLFIDEAGQYSLANAVGVGLAARNIVLVGDQRQLAQPVLGSHPGESGCSVLEYLLQSHETIPPDFGVFLGVTRRMHPRICGFISEAFYEGRLQSHKLTAFQQLVIPEKSTFLTKKSGILFHPVDHSGNGQGSDEERDAIAELVQELLQCKVHEADGKKPRRLLLDDLLVVAPFNLQVRQLQQRLGDNARVGSIDRFQGQEAHVVILSLCSSSLEDSPRGADFLLDPNRLNVAVSRARTLAVVVGSPRLMSARCQTIREMELVNQLCWLVDHAERDGDV